MLGWHLCNDATKILAEVCIDYSTGYMSGLNGSPIVVCPETERGLQQLLVQSIPQIAENALLFLALPIFCSSDPSTAILPPQHIAMMATNNREETIDVVHHHSIILREGHKFGMRFFSIAADGDSRQIATHYSLYERVDHTSSIAVVNAQVMSHPAMIMHPIAPAKLFPTQDPCVAYMFCKFGCSAAQKYSH